MKTHINLDGLTLEVAYEYDGGQIVIDGAWVEQGGKDIPMLDMFNEETMAQIVELCWQEVDTIRFAKGF